MFGLDIEGRYRRDNTFRHVVDLLRAMLSQYHVTPSELREASMLAAAIHESENIRPLYYAHMSENGKGMRDIIPPAMFGGLDWASDFTVSGCTSGRIQSSTPNFTVQDKKAGLEKTAAPAELKERRIKERRTKHLWADNPRGLFGRSYTVNRRKKITPFQQHVFGGIKKIPYLADYRICVRCGLSTTYLENSTDPCKGTKN